MSASSAVLPALEQGLSTGCRVGGVDWQTSLVLLHHFLLPPIKSAAVRCHPAEREAPEEQLRQPADLSSRWAGRRLEGLTCWPGTQRTLPRMQKLESSGLWAGRAAFSFLDGHLHSNPPVSSPCPSQRCLALQQKGKTWSWTVLLSPSCCQAGPDSSLDGSVRVRASLV